MLKKVKMIYILLLAFIFLMGMPSTGKTDFTDVTHPLEGEYFFYGADRYGNDFEYKITFDLWQDVGAGLYQYKYILTNLDDASNAQVQDIEISHIADLETVSWDPGTYAPSFYSDSGSSVTFVWSPWVPENQTTTWFWFTTPGAPALLNSWGDGSIGSSASGKLPAPVPEPSAFILLGLGLLLAGMSTRFIVA